MSFGDYVVQLHGDKTEFSASYPFPGVTQGKLTGHKLFENTQVKVSGTWEFVDSADHLRFNISDDVVLDLKYEGTMIYDGQK